MRFARVAEDSAVVLIADDRSVDDLGQVNRAIARVESALHAAIEPRRAPRTRSGFPSRRPSSAGRRTCRHRGMTADQTARPGRAATRRRDAGRTLRTPRSTSTSRASWRSPPRRAASRGTIDAGFTNVATRPPRRPPCAAVTIQTSRSIRSKEVLAVVASKVHLVARAVERWPIAVSRCLRACAGFFPRRTSAPVSAAFEPLGASQSDVPWSS